ncbi:MAG: hypothetical protein IPN40_16455 [Uliginosibacterium sp.]|nr:hypothetical protein [Uliginosibacterium sp.]
MSIGEVDEQKFSQGVLALFAACSMWPRSALWQSIASQDPVGKADVSLGTSHYAQW